MRNQTIYNKAKRYFSKTGAVQAVDENGDCQYYVPETGRRCAVGCLLTVEQALEMPAGTAQAPDVARKLREFLGDDSDIKFLNSLQCAHDTVDPGKPDTVQRILRNFEAVAVKYGLEV